MGNADVRAAVKPPLPPSPVRRYPGQHLIAINRDRLGFLQRVVAECGDVAYLSLGPGHLAVLTHPDDIRDVLVTNKRNFVKGRGLERSKRLLGNGLLTSEGSFHLRQRRLAQPAFHRERIAGYAAVMASYTEKTRDSWTAGATIDVGREMMALTLAIAGKTLLNVEVGGGDTRAIGEALSEVMRLFNIALLPFAEYFDHLPLPWNVRFDRARATLDNIIYRVIAERRASGEDRGDLLSMLMMAQDAEGDGGAMTDEQLRDEAMTIFLAGHETTANALTFTWYLLSQHPDVERRMCEEVATVLRGRTPSMEDVMKLSYVRAVFTESMRLLPPAWTLGYRAVEEYSVKGFRIPAGTLVLMPQYIVHRDPRWYSDPLRFDPDRWLPPNAVDRPRFAYFPFGGGVRQCIGEQFAWTEGILVLATMVQKWRLRIPQNTPLAVAPSFTLRPKDRVLATLEPAVMDGKHAR
jgi:cytochrome P450